MSKRKKLLFYVLLVLFTYGFSEVLSFLCYFTIKRKIFSFSQYQSARLTILAPEIIESSPEGGGIINWEGFYEVVHPYLGFVGDPNNTDGVSEYGFYGASPVGIKTDDQLIIGIFGGSFAFSMSLFSKDVFINELKQISKFQDKEIVVHTIALGGYKQPQQLFALSYLLSLGAYFDLVINLDGFNEVALPPVENIPKNVFPFYPRHWFARVHAFNDRKMLTLIGEISLFAEKQKRWAKLFATTPLRYNITCNLLWGFYNKSLSKKKVEREILLKQYTLKREASLKYLATGPSFHYTHEAEMYKALAEVWRRSSIQMNQLCEAGGIEYFHFLQPNQYVAGSKTMQAEELQRAFQEDHPYKEGVEKGYPYLLSAGRYLVDQGVIFHDLTMIFANHDEPLYNDTCCHLNKKGYDMIARTIGKIIVEYNMNH